MEGERCGLIERFVKELCRKYFQLCGGNKGSDRKPAYLIITTVFTFKAT